MYDLKVPHLSAVNSETTLDTISLILDDLVHNTIDTTPWPAFAYKPEVSFAIAYTKDSLLLKYYVHERSLRGLYAQANVPVHEDSCLEFFISFDDGDAYYNIELNCIGTCSFGYGKYKECRQVIPGEMISKIRRQIVIRHLQNDSPNPVYLELIVVIPIEVFIYHEIGDLKGKNCRVNFFKCGDKLPEPHFLAWKNIVATAPDFICLNFSVTCISFNK